MNFADKSRMPIDEKKVREMLRHQHEFRQKLTQQIGNYEDIKNDEQFQYGILLY